MRSKRSYLSFTVSYIASQLGELLERRGHTPHPTPSGMRPVLKLVREFPRLRLGHISRPWEGCHDAVSSPVPNFANC